MNPLRWGLLSTAHINRRVIPAIRASQRGSLAAVASRDIKKSQAYAAEWNIPRAFGSYEEMLASDDVDIVYNSLPNHLHAPWTIKAMQAGKHVLCEKPFALSTEEVDQVAAVSRETGRIVAEAFMYRHHPQTRQVASWIHSGKLGDVRLVRSIFSFLMNGNNRSGNVRLVPEYGGGSLWDVGIYPISYVRLLYGELPESVSAQQWLGQTGVDEVFSAQLFYSNGRSAQIACGFNIPFFTSLDVHGSSGRIELNRPFTQLDDPERTFIYTAGDGSQEEIETPHVELYLGEVEDMHAAILDGKPNLVTLAESRDHVQMACALYQAARTGEIVLLG